MDEIQFWNIIDTGKHFEDPEECAEALRGQLNSLEDEEVAAFDRQFRRARDRAYDWKLWAAAYLVMGGCSDDAFEYFRNWLISRGRESFEAALNDGDVISDFPIDDEEVFFEFEDFGYVAREVYEEKTGGELPIAESKPDSPSGEPWDEDDDEYFRTNLPRLFDRDSAGRTSPPRLGGLRGLWRRLFGSTRRDDNRPQ